MPFGIGLPEILIFLVVVLLLFGAKRVPEIGRSVGKGMREFKDAVSGRDDEAPPRLPAPEDEERAAEPAPPRERDTVS
jgi:sec-independent protein translocase protein TatA